MNKKNKKLIVGGVIALAVILVAAALIGRFSPAADPHAGHDHGTQQTDPADPHAGHDHGTQQTDPANPTGSGSGTGHTHAPNSEAKIIYKPTEHEDGTYSFTLKDPSGKVLFSKDGLDRYPLVEGISEDVYSVGWPTGTGPNDFQQVYCHREKGLVSQVFDGPIGSDGVRVALPHKDGVLVRDVFDEKAYSKVHPLPNAYTKGAFVIAGGKLIEGHKAVRVSYVTDDKGTTVTTVIELYAK